MSSGIITVSGEMEGVGWGHVGGGEGRHAERKQWYSEEERESRERGEGRRMQSGWGKKREWKGSKGRDREGERKGGGSERWKETGVRGE